MEDIAWKKWLDEKVVWKYNELIPRRVALTRFVEGGLIPFIEKHNYVLREPKLLGSRIATGLYTNAGKRFDEWRFGVRDEFEYEHEYRNYYNYLVKWEHFWKKWAAWCDVEDVDRQHEIESYVWTQISIEYSVHTRTVNELLGLDEDDENISEHNGKDIYLKDAADSNEWGGYRK